MDHITTNTGENVWQYININACLLHSIPFHDLVVVVHFLLILLTHLLLFDFSDSRFFDIWHDNGRQNVIDDHSEKKRANNDDDEPKAKKQATAKKSLLPTGDHPFIMANEPTELGKRIQFPLSLFLSIYPFHRRLSRHSLQQKYLCILSPTANKKYPSHPHFRRQTFVIYVFSLCEESWRAKTI